MEQNLQPLPPVIFENGLYYELKGEQYYPCLLPPKPDTTEDKLLETIIRHSIWPSKCACQGNEFP